eukprot:353436-Chlamydomonas_euryale.AAC.3
MLWLYHAMPWHDVMPAVVRVHDSQSREQQARSVPIGCWEFGQRIPYVTLRPRGERPGSAWKPCV